MTSWFATLDVGRHSVFFRFVRSVPSGATSLTIMPPFAAAEPPEPLTDRRIRPTLTPTFCWLRSLSTVMSASLTTCMRVLVALVAGFFAAPVSVTPI